MLHVTMQYLKQAAEESHYSNHKDDANPKLGGSGVGTSCGGFFWHNGGCDDGFACQTAGDANDHTCQPKVGLGSYCNSDIGIECVDGTYCDPPSFPTGVCTNEWS